MDIMLIKEFIWGIGKILSDRKMIVTILAISIIFGSSISQFDGFAAAKDDESVIEKVNFESCCCCASNIFKTESDAKEMSDLEKQTHAKALEDRGKYRSDLVVCIYEKLKSKTRICCSDGKTTKCCDAISGDSTITSLEFGGPIPTGKWLIAWRREHEKHNRAWFNLLKLKMIIKESLAFFEYNENIYRYNRKEIGLHSGTRSLGCITVIDTENNRENRPLEDDSVGNAKVTHCWKELSGIIYKGKLTLAVKKKNRDFHGFLYVQYLYEEVEPKFENTIISNSVVDLVIYKDDLSDIISSPPSLFKRGNYEPKVLKKIDKYPYEEKHPNNGQLTGNGDHKDYPYRWRYRATKNGEHKIKDFILDNIPDDPWNTANWGNWVASDGWELKKIEKNKNETWKITWETDTPVDAVMVGFDHKFALDPEHPKGDCGVSFDGIPDEWGKITVPLDEPPTIEKQPLTGVFSTYNLLPDNVIELNVRVVGDFYSDKIYDIEIFPEAQNPPWYGIDAIEAPEGWSYEKTGNGVRFFTLTDPLIKCQPKKFIFRVWGIRISRYIEVHITDKDHENLGVIMSTWWQLKKVYRH